MAVNYKASAGAPFKHKDAMVIGRRLERLEAAGPVTPQAVVDDAMNEDSPLHPYFEWDDTDAARKYRLHQARNIINHLTIVYAGDDGESSMKGFHSVTLVMADDEEERAYASMATVSNDPGLRKQVLETAKRELLYWKARYGQYQELWPVTRAIDETVGVPMPQAARTTKKRKKRARAKSA